MPSNPKILALPILFCAVFASHATESETPVPSYANALETMQREQTATAGPKLSTEDKATMARAAMELEQAMPQPGLQVGDSAPDFSLPDAFGKPVRLADMLNHGPVVLTFYRGAWCPFCNLQLRQLTTIVPRIEAAGARLVAVTPQQPDKSRDQVEKDGFPFPILSDLDDRVTKAYGLYFELPDDLNAIYRQRLMLDIAAYNGPGRYGLPVPGTFVIARDGTVTAAFADVDYRKRMEPAAMVVTITDDALEFLRWVVPVMIVYRGRHQSSIALWNHQRTGDTRPHAAIGVGEFEFDLHQPAGWVDNR